MNQAQIDARYKAAREIAREAGHRAIEFFRRFEDVEVRMKGRQDRVSEADLAIETFIRAQLNARFPEDAFLGEETANGNGDDNGNPDTSRGLWVVDPIDGTDCFVKGIPVWCVSIAWMEGGVITLGVIYDPNHDELFSARLGQGAWLNGTRLSVAEAESCEDGLVGVGHSTRVTPAPTLLTIERLLNAGGMFQRSGSGALSLAWVAAGRLIGYIEPHINSWDCLAGILLVSEAGGWINDFLGNNGIRRGNQIIAAAAGMAENMRYLGAAAETGTRNGATVRYPNPCNCVSERPGCDKVYKCRIERRGAEPTPGRSGRRHR